MLTMMIMSFLKSRRERLSWWKLLGRPEKTLRRLTAQSDGQEEAMKRLISRL